MGNFSATSFPADRWADSDPGSSLDLCIASIDSAIKHVLGCSANTLTAPFAITDAGAVTFQVSMAIGTSNDIDDIVDTIPASPGASEDTELATVEAIRAFVLTGAGTLDSTTLETDTTDFDGILSSADDTFQKALDTIDDHTHSYLPLAAGSGNPLTDSLYITRSLGLGASLQIGDGSVTSRFSHTASKVSMLWQDADAGGQSGIFYEIKMQGGRPAYITGQLDPPTATSVDIALATDLAAYLPLTAGATKPLTGDLEIEDGSSNTQHNLASASGNVDLCQQSGTLTVGGTQVALVSQLGGAYVPHYNVGTGRLRIITNYGCSAAASGTVQQAVRARVSDFVRTLDGGGASVTYSIQDVGSGLTYSVTGNGSSDPADVYINYTDSTEWVAGPTTVELTIKVDDGFLAAYSTVFLVLSDSDVVGF